LTVRRRVLVEGRVQGVGFRASTVERARSIDPTLAGFVRNLPDGRVEAVIEGEERSVLELVRWCRSGPPSSQVRRLG
jgi:acylphosphatase